jgi:type IV pilus assembly protein PilB
LRIDGQLLHWSEGVDAWPERDRLITRIKLLSRMDIAEKRLPQDGRVQVICTGSSSPSETPVIQDLRVSSLPTLLGEKLVLRLIQNSHSLLTLEDLGLQGAGLHRLQTALEQRQGLILMTGPTGSGKTQTLYACLRLLQNKDLNICTVEDPCELPWPGLHQVNVNEKAGLTFAEALRSFLRQDPDVMMVGEIRDFETAEMVFKAAQTGHLVLSSLHTPDACSTITRLKQMGIEPYVLAASLHTVVSQRLLRRVCAFCKGSCQQPDGRKCAHCHKGYKGRVGVFETLTLTDDLRSLIHARADLTDLRHMARNIGCTSLRQEGIRLASLNMTTHAEAEMETPAEH